MAEQIRDSQVIKTPEVVIDPQFFVPDDVVGARPATLGELIPNDPDNDYLTGVDYDPEVVNSDSSGAVDSVDAEPGTDLSAPQFVTVLSQTVRTATDGTTVVDVVLQVEDVPGATNYEVRITTS